MSAATSSSGHLPRLTFGGKTGIVIEPFNKMLLLLLLD